MKIINSSFYAGGSYEIKFSPDGELLFHTRGTEMVALNVPDLTRQFSLNSWWTSEASSVVCHPKKPLLIILGYGLRPTNLEQWKRLPVYNYETGEVFATLPLVDMSIAKAIFIGENLLAYASEYGSYLYSFDQQENVGKLLYDGEDFYSMCLHPNGQTLMSSYSSQGDTTLHFLNMSEHIVPVEQKEPAGFYKEWEQNSINLETSQISAANFSPNGRYFVVTYNVILLYSYPERQLLFTINSNGECGSTYKADRYSNPNFWSNGVFSSDSHYLYCGSHEGFIYCWNVVSGELVEKIRSHESQIWRLAISPDGHILASIGNDKSLKLFDLSS
jgi:WD40 repeat protein